MTSLFSEQFTGLYATPELVGRQDILDQFERILNNRSPNPKIVFLTGLGGIGKTRLLKKALEMARTHSNMRVAGDVLDLYHIMLHSPVGLANAIFEVLTPPFDCFQNYQPAYQALNRARLSGNVVELSKLREDAVVKFDQDLQQLGDSANIVLALDTAERVVYGLEKWTSDIPLADSWNWLIEHISAWKNLIIFAAGREESRPSLEKFKEIHPDLIEEINVGLFTEAESLAYFNSVAHLAKEKKDFHFAERLNKMSPDFKRGAHIYSNGRPIVLSLLVDYLSFPGESELPEILRNAHLEKMNETDHHRFEEIILERLQQGQIGETLIALGRVPKGADSELISALLSIPQSEAQKRLKEVQSLSIVKIRPEDQRVFLHDEMYALLQRHVYDSPYDASKKKAAFESIKEYYQTQRDACIKRLGDLYAPVEQEGRENLDLEQIASTYAERQTVLSEMMFYFLRQDFGRGFRHYYRFSQEAIYSHDILMDMHLQAEMLSFLVRLPAEELERNVQGEFSPQMLLATLRLRPIMRSWAESKFKEAVERADHLLEQIEDPWKNAFPVVLASLHIWSAYAYVMRSAGDDFAKSVKHLEAAFSLFPDEITQSVQEPEKGAEQSNGKYSLTEVWYTMALLALAYRVQGYMYRVRGYPQQAIENYRRDIEWLNLLDIRVEQSTALNDIGFALATQGKWQDGRSLARDALGLRRELGHRLPVAFSLNTLAMIDIYEGQYDSAQNNAEHALAIFRARYDDRGKGLALIALSEARRRYAITNPVLEAERRIELIRQARDHANEAKIIFSQSIEEPPRKVEALIEMGCACRDWVRLRGIYPNPKDNRKRLIAEAEDALLQAYKTAYEEDLRYRAIDALVNLAWLRYYVLEKEENEIVDDNHPLWQAIQLAHQSIPPEYFLTAGKPSIQRANAQIEIWPQLGKLYLLEGNIEHYKLDKISKEDKKKFAASGQGKHVQETLEKLAEKYSASLQYSALYEKDYRGIRGAKDQIYERLKGLNASERYVFCKKIHDLYADGDSVIERLLRDRVVWLE